MCATRGEDLIYCQASYQTAVLSIIWHHRGTSTGTPLETVKLYHATSININRMQRSLPSLRFGSPCAGHLSGQTLLYCPIESRSSVFSPLAFETLDILHLHYYCTYEYVQHGMWQSTDRSSTQHQTKKHATYMPRNLTQLRSVFRCSLWNTRSTLEHYESYSYQVKGIICY